MYTVNQDDVHPVVGPSEKYPNFFLCNGFSGHGFKLAPAVGSLLSQQILGGRCQTSRSEPRSRWDSLARLGNL